MSFLRTGVDAAGEGVNLQRGAHLMVNYDPARVPGQLERKRRPLPPTKPRQALA